MYMPTTKQPTSTSDHAEAVITAVENKSIIVKSHMSRLHLSAVHTTTGTRRATDYGQKIKNVMQSSILLPG